MMQRIKTVWTATLNSELDNITQLLMINTALSKLEGPCDFVIFDPEATEHSREDQGRTARVPSPRLSEKVYAQLEDHGGDIGTILMICKASER
jgi:hypothetical protein